MTAAGHDPAAGPYGPEVARLFAATPGAGRPAAAERAGWLSGAAREPLSSTQVRVHLRVAAGRVAELRYEVRGCPHTIAACALLATELPGCALGDLKVDPAGLAARLGAPPAKLGRLFVIEDAIRAAALQSGAAIA
jgi:hypothetical protein